MVPSKVRNRDGVNYFQWLIQMEGALLAVGIVAWNLLMMSVVDRELVRLQKDQDILVSQTLENTRLLKLVLQKLQVPPPPQH